MEAVKQVPYGVADFESVIELDLYYVDKTMYLAELVKQPDTLIFIRPRRFGKSLFISMMRAYYDKSKAKDFDTLFGSLWISSHPTPLRAIITRCYILTSLAYSVTSTCSKRSSIAIVATNSMILSTPIATTIQRRELKSFCAPTIMGKNSTCCSICQGNTTIVSHH